MNIVRQAPAKVNLFLRMNGRREDGYHLLFSAMQTIGIYDTVKLEVLPSAPSQKPKIDFKSNLPYLTADPKKNTAVKAAVLFLDAIDEAYDVSIEIEKNIPSQAGLGGGSSDGAAVLMALDELLPGRVLPEQLLSMAVKIGADVPFFLKGGTMLCEGVGEVMTDLPNLANIPMLILKPSAGVSTPKCYAKFDEMGLSGISEEEKSSILREFRSDISMTSSCMCVRNSATLWKNDLQIPAMLEVPCMQEGLELMRRNGAVFSAMSGSGSALFGLFETEEQIDALLSTPEIQRLIKEKWWVCKTTTI